MKDLKVPLVQPLRSRTAFKNIKTSWKSLMLNLTQNLNKIHRFKTNLFQTLIFKILKNGKVEKNIFLTSFFSLFTTPLDLKNSSGDQLDVFLPLSNGDGLQSRQIFCFIISFVVLKIAKCSKIGKNRTKNFSNSHVKVFVWWFCFNAELQI